MDRINSDYPLANLFPVLPTDVIGTAKSKYLTAPGGIDAKEIGAACATASGAALTIPITFPITFIASTETLTTAYDAFIRIESRSGNTDQLAINQNFDKVVFVKQQVTVYIENGIGKSAAT
jgi:hypothetical protein